MNKRLSFKLIVLTTVALLCKPALAQETSYLTQKLMLENDIRSKITEALSKIIDEQKYVIDVSVDLELSSELQEQITVAPATDATRTGRLDDLTAVVEEAASQLERGSPYDNYLPIPGFEFEMSGPSQEDAVPVEAEGVPTATMENGDKILSRVVTDRKPSIARVRKMDISLILQEGAAPELIENIRQIVMVASRFNRARGDALSIMTASFKERRDQRSAEAILLKSIADKVEAMEKQRKTEAVTAEKDWRQELEDYKQEEAQRREKDRTYFESELSKIEMAARTRAFQQEKRDILQRDSLRLINLNQEIQALRSQMSSAALSEPEAQATQVRVAQIEGERSALDAQISEKIATLESVQTELDKRQGGMNNLPLYLMGMLTFLSVIALVIVLVMTNRTKPRYAPPPPWMMQQQRPRKKKRVPKKVVSAEEPAPQPVAPIAPVAQPAPVATSPPPPVADDPGVMRSEINDMRKAVVSMSVGQPETATRIVREWMQEEAPPEPAESEAAPEEESEETKGKKKKK
ncbi:MAG: hypothetical protein HQ562_07700 [Candidatus Marinimicrobia bacterium]|nr:hypothetical protein [Candidatus Neomarinimicrobiota bacterium]